MSTQHNVVRLPNGDLALMADESVRHHAAEAAPVELALQSPDAADKPSGEHFTPRELADHFGLAVDEVRVALDEADTGRYLAYRWAEVKAACNAYLRRHEQ